MNDDRTRHANRTHFFTHGVTPTRLRPGPGGKVNPMGVTQTQTPETQTDIVELEYAPPIWFKPQYRVKYIVRTDRAKKCREMYGWGTSAFWSCVDNDPNTVKIRIE